MFMVQRCQKYALHQKTLQFYQNSIQSYTNFPDFLKIYVHNFDENGSLHKT